MPMKNMVMNIFFRRGENCRGNCCNTACVVLSKDPAKKKYQAHWWWPGSSIVCWAAVPSQNSSCPLVLDASHTAVCCFSCHIGKVFSSPAILTWSRHYYMFYTTPPRITFPAHMIVCVCVCEDHCFQ